MTTRRPVFAIAALAALAAASAAPAAGQEQEPLKVKAVYSSVIEEPWDGVIHAALEAEAAAGRITHTRIRTTSATPATWSSSLRDIAENEQPDIIFGDSFGNEEAVRRVAADYPEIPFVFGSGGGPAEPNFSVFDNWIHEPAYLAGHARGRPDQVQHHRRRRGLPRAGGQPHHERVHRGRPGAEPRRRGQGHLHQQLVRPGDGQGGRPGADRRGRGRPVRRALRRHRGSPGEAASWPSATWPTSRSSRPRTSSRA